MHGTKLQNICETTKKTATNLEIKEKTGTMYHFFIMSFDSITSGRFFHYNKKTLCYTCFMTVTS